MATPKMDETPSRDILFLGPIGRMLGSQRLAVFESLTVARRHGLTIPQMVRSSGVPSATLHRIIKEFEEKGLIRTVGKDGKAPIFMLDASSRAAVETARTLMDHARRVAALKAGTTHHGGESISNEGDLVTISLSMRKNIGTRHRPTVSYNADVKA